MREIEPLHSNRPSPTAIDAVLAASLDGAFQLKHVGSGRFAVFSVLGPDDNKTEWRMGTWDEATARAVLAYASRHSALARNAARKLHLYADPGPMQILVQSAKDAAARPFRRERVTIELELEMFGSDEELLAYVQQRLAYAVRFKRVLAIRLEGPAKEV